MRLLNNSMRTTSMRASIDVHIAISIKSNVSDNLNGLFMMYLLLKTKRDVQDHLRNQFSAQCITYKSALKLGSM